MHASKVLLWAAEPCAGGVEAFMSRQRMMESSIRTVCGIGLSMKDEATSLLSSQFVFIGKLLHPIHPSHNAPFNKCFVLSVKFCDFLRVTLPETSLMHIICLKASPCIGAGGEFLRRCLCHTVLLLLICWLCSGTVCPGHAAICFDHKAA
jgi:hypothetical protein